MKVHPAEQKVTCCNAPACAQAADATLGQKPLCRQHLISSCLARLDAAARVLDEETFDGARLKPVRTFIAECVQAVTEPMCGADNLRDAEYESLLNVLLRALELSQRLRLVGSPGEVPCR